jgi:hypothetical protein
VQRDRVEQVHLVAAPRERQRVGARAAADVEDDRGRWREVALQQLERAGELQAAPVLEAPGLAALVVEGGDLAVVGHGVAP